MGRTYIEFVTSLDSIGVDAGGTSGSGGRRSLASEDEDTPAAMPLDIIFAAGPVPGLVYHTSQRRGAAQIDLASGAAKAERTVPGGTPQQRYDHGVLMWTAWGAVLPFGIGIGKLIRPTKSKAVLYAHIFCQLSGLAIATAGLAIATVNFRGLTDTPFSHGQLGVAVMALLYYQFLNGLLRPHAIDDYSERSFWTTARRVWEHVHSLLGFATLALAAVNCVLGIIILSDRFLEMDFLETDEAYKKV